MSAVATPRRVYDLVEMMPGMFTLAKIARHLAGAERKSPSNQAVRKLVRSMIAQHVLDAHPRPDAKRRVRTEYLYPGVRPLQTFIVGADAPSRAGVRGGVGGDAAALRAAPPTNPAPLEPPRLGARDAKGRTRTERGWKWLDEDINRPIEIRPRTPDDPPPDRQLLGEGFRMPGQINRPRQRDLLDPRTNPYRDAAPPGSLGGGR